MNFKKCLVLGGAGFLGRHLCAALAQQKQDVRAFTRNPDLRVDFQEQNSQEQIEWFIGDFNNPDDLYKAVQGCHVIYHLISSTTPGTSNLDPVKDIQCNLEGTLRLLKIAQTEGVQKIIFVSSGGTVYGIPQSIPIQEDAHTNPICSYGISKLAIEKYLYMYHVLHGLNYCVLRVSNLFGEYQVLTKGQGVVGVFMAKVLRGESVEIWGDGEVVRDYIYVQDVITALLRTLHYEGEQRIFNIGSGVGRSLNQVLSSLETVINCNIKKIYKPGRALDVPVNILDISKATEYLKWSPKTDWMYALHKTYQWMLTTLE